MLDDPEYLRELFAGVGAMQIKRMFGCYALLVEGRMFALQDGGGQLYLKVDDHNRQGFLDLGLTPFTYERRGEVASLHYYRAPEAILDDPDEATAWGRRSLEAALRAPAPKKKAGQRAAARQAAKAAAARARTAPLR